jgi:heme/copper-type cytochrome/quinol oxidase subunit 2
MKIIQVIIILLILFPQKCNSNENINSKKQYNKKNIIGFITNKTLLIIIIIIGVFLIFILTFCLENIIEKRRFARNVANLVLDYDLY